MLSLLISVVICFCYELAGARLNVTPRDTEAKVGETTYLNCSSDILTEHIHWFHGGLFVYAGGSFYEPYLGHYAIEKSSAGGVYNLLIQSVKRNYSGEYTCTDDGGRGEKSLAAQLIVLENDPVCESNLDLSEVIGPNSCGIEPDELRLSCNTRYSGDLPPKMVWRKSGDEIPITEGIESVKSQSGSEVIYHLKMNASISMDGQSYVCETTRSVANQYKCNSGMVRILYAYRNETVVNRKMDDEIICWANSNAQCSYTWISIQHGNKKVLSAEQTLKPENPGRYQCEAICLMKTNSCSFVAMVIEVSSIPQKAGKLWLVVLVTVPIVILIIAVIIFCIMKRQRESNNKQKHSNIKERDTTTDTLLQSSAFESSKEAEIKETSATVEMDQTHVNKSTIPEKDQNAKNLDSPTEQQQNVSRNDEVPISTQNQKDVEENRKDERKQEPEEHGYLKIGEMEIFSKEIRAMTILDNDIWIVIAHPIALVHYDIGSYTVLGGYPAIDLETPHGMAACSNYKYIYVSDATRKDVQKQILKYDQNGKMTKKWSTKFDFGSLSVSKDSNIILTACESNKILEYEPRGVLLRIVKLSQGFYPSHAIKLNKHKFLVSYGHPKYKEHLVCVVTVKQESKSRIRYWYEETIEKSFGNMKGSSDEELNVPSALAVNRNGDVYVLDEGNKRVLLLSSNLEYKKKICLEKYQLHHPVCLVLDETNSQLFIADDTLTVDKSGKCNGLFVFKIS